MKQQFTRLTGDVGNVQDLIQIQRLGKIRLGLKKQNGQGKEYPSETEYFVCPPEVQAVYGESPTVLDGIFPSNDPNEVYQEKLALYGTSQGLKCHGDGVRAERRNEQTGEWVPIQCPCKELKSDENPRGQCSPQANLKVTLPKVSMWGYYQITTRSLFARGGLLGALQQMQQTLGRIGGIPVKIVRLPKDITPKGGKKKTHYILSFIPDMTLQQIIELRNNPDILALPSYVVEPAVDDNPLLDPVDVVTDEDEGGVDADALSRMDEKQLEEVNRKLQEQRKAQSMAAPVQTAAPTTPSAPRTQGSAPPLIKRFGPGVILQSEWEAAIAQIKTMADWAILVGDWKAERNISNELKLNVRGQQELLAHLRKQIGPSFPY